MDRYDTNVKTTKNAPRRDMAPDEGRLVHLDDVKDQFEVADGNPDIRGWDIKTSDGRKIGEVDGLIVDTGKRKVRYLEAKVDHDILGTDDDRWMLLPIGRTRLDDDNDEVLLDTNATDLRSMPTSDRSHGRGHGWFSRDEERSLRDRFRDTDDRRSTASISDRDDMYSGDHFDDRRFLGKRGRSSSSDREQSYFVPVVVEEVIVARPVSKDDDRTTSSVSNQRRTTGTTETRSERR